MTRYGLVCLLLGALAWGQAASPTATPAAQKPPSPAGSAQPGAAPAATPGASEQPDLSKIPPDQPIITIAGLCDHPPADKAAAADCKTVITREDFEKIVNAIQPSMPQRARRQFATRYADALIKAQKAHEMGLDQGSEFEEHMKLARLQVLMTEFGQATQKKASQISDQEIEDYYQKNTAEFEEADIQHIYIPRVQQPSATKTKAAAAAAGKGEKKDTSAGEQTMKAEAEKLLVRAKAGEDFDKLQAEAFQVAGIKIKAPTTKLGEVRRSGLSPSQVSCMDLKKGAISSLLSDTAGYYICKVGQKETPSLDKVKDEIRGTLISQRMQEAMESVEHSATPTFEDAYFGPAPPPGQRGGMPMPRPMPPSAQPPSSGPK